MSPLLKISYQNNDHGLKDYESLGTLDNTYSSDLFCSLTELAVTTSPDNDKVVQLSYPKFEEYGRASVNRNGFFKVYKKIDEPWKLVLVGKDDAYKVTVQKKKQTGNYKSAEDLRYNM